MITPFLSTPLSQMPAIRHGFFTRKGGVSTGLYAGLNCGYGSGDDKALVTLNRAQIAQSLGTTADRLCTAYQIHSTKIFTVTEPWKWQDSHEGDALVTNVPGIAIAVLAADCAPVLFADPKNKVVGAAHSGWKGAIGGVLEATLAAMETLGAETSTIMASIGPAIAQASYEVGAEFRERFMAELSNNATYFLPATRPDHYLFDLKSYIHGRLQQARVQNIHIMANDTFTEEDDFYSFRRATLRKEPVYGRQISAIMLS